MVKVNRTQSVAGKSGVVKFTHVMWKFDAVGVIIQGREGPVLLILNPVPLVFIMSW